MDMCAYEHISQSSVRFFPFCKKTVLSTGRTGCRPSVAFANAAAFLHLNWWGLFVGLSDPTIALEAFKLTSRLRGFHYPSPDWILHLRPFVRNT
jgi:hypothetical protein